MKRREFSKRILASGMGLAAVQSGFAYPASKQQDEPQPGMYLEKERQLPVRNFDVVVAGGGTGGVFAAVAAARTGAKTALIEGKGFTGGVAVQGGTALHSFYNLWKPFAGVKKKQVIQGLPIEFIDKLYGMGGCTGHADVVKGYDYDSVCTAIDTELYKLASLQFLRDAGVHIFLNTFVRGAAAKDGHLEGVLVESRSGREFFSAKSFIDATGYGDLAAYAGAQFTEPNDYAVVNSFGVGNADIDKYHQFFKKHGALQQVAYGTRSGEEGGIIRVGADAAKLPQAFLDDTRGFGVSHVTTTVHDNHFMFLKTNMKLPESPTDRDTVTDAEIKIRENQYLFMEAFRKHIPGMEKAFISRTSASLDIRRARCIKCDYDISNDEIISATHFDDEVFNYGFHDSAPRYQVGKGETYGLPYRALLVTGMNNLFATGMMITSQHSAHMSTRNTVSCMAQGQAAGTAAALCASAHIGTRDLSFSKLKDHLVKNKVYFEG